MGNLIGRDLYVRVGKEVITMEEYHHRWGVGRFPKAIVGNCFQLGDYKQLPLSAPTGWISDGVLPLKSKLLLFGEPKTGKSFLAMQLGYSIAENNDWLGFGTLKIEDIDTTVLYIQSEIAEVELQDRLRCLSGNPAFYIETIHGAKLLGRNISILEDRLKKVKPDVLILDPMYMYIEGDLTKIADVTKCNSLIDMIIGKYGCSVVVVHHSRKPKLEGTQGMMEALGSVGITAFYDSILWLSRDEEGNTLHFTLRNARSPKPLVLEQDKHGFFKSISQINLPFLDIYTPVHDIMKLVDVPEGLLREHLTRMTKMGYLEKDTWGKYKTKVS